MIAGMAVSLQFVKNLPPKDPPHPPTPSPTRAEGELDAAQPLTSTPSNQAAADSPAPSNEAAADSPLPTVGEGLGVRGTRAYVEAIGELSNYYTEQYDAG